MKPKSLRDYINLYEKKTGDKFVVRNDYVLFFLPERGFMTAKPDLEASMLIIEYVCGDIHFWHGFAELKCRELGLAHIGTFCNRNIDAYLRNVGVEILDEQNIDNKRRLLCQDSIGRMVLVTYQADLGEGKEQYTVVQYLDRKAISSFERLKESG